MSLYKAGRKKILKEKYANDKGSSEAESKMLVNVSFLATSLIIRERQARPSSGHGYVNRANCGVRMRMSILQYSLMLSIY